MCGPFLPSSPLFKVLAIPVCSALVCAGLHLQDDLSSRPSLLLPEGGLPQWIHLYASKCNTDTIFTCLSAFANVHFGIAWADSGEIG